MIYASTSCIKKNSIKESVVELAQQGFTNIELSGGTKFYAEYERDLLKLQDEYSLNYQVHNYFPPPPKPFILNLATLDDELYNQSIDHCIQAIQISKNLGGKKYGFHAGFLIDFTTQEAGKRISFRPISNREQSIKRFTDAWKKLTDIAASDVKLYIENNVFSATNHRIYAPENPFMLTSYSDYKDLKKKINFNFLLDLAHLKVSANSHNINFNNEIKKLLPLTDYLHISGNDGLHDQNLGVEEDKILIEVLRDHDLSNKTITLEVYGGIEALLRSYNYIKTLL